MQKTATLKNFKVFLFKTLLMSIVLSISVMASFAQEGLQKPASAKKGLPTERPKESSATQAASGPKKALVQQAFGGTGTANASGAANVSDVPAINAKYAEKMQSAVAAGESFTSSTIPPTASLTAATCVFDGSLTASDPTIANRIARLGVISTCAAPKACPGPNGTGPVYFDSYTMQNLTCATQCVTVTYENVGQVGDVFVTAYSGSFSAANVCTNYLADGGTSVPVGAPAVTYSFNLAANATIVLVASGVGNLVECPSYRITVTGINCAPPPPCVPPTSSVLSQAGGVPVATNVFSETFNTVVPLPAGWASQNLSAPVGTTGWFQGNAAVFGANSGAGYIAANFNNTTGANTISNWLFTPNVTLKNGDRFSFFTRTTTGTFPDRLQVRMSTNGTSVNAGTSNTSVGDFTTLLLDINPTYTGTGYPTAWTQYTVTLSGLPNAGVSGRLAFRYFVESGGPAGANSDYIGIDDVVYTTFTPGPITTCTGSTANLKVDITGGNGAAYDVRIQPSVGPAFTVTNYVSGSLIPVTPAVTTSYTLVSVVQSDNPCCVGTGNSGNPTVTVLATNTPPVMITSNPSTTLCAGDPTLLNVTGAPALPLFSNTGSIAIPSSGPATPYPSAIAVSGLPATGVSVVSVTLNGFNHTWSNDVDVLVQSPTGQNVVLMSDVGGGNAVTNATYTFSDAGAVMSTTAANPTGTYRPTNSGTPDTWIAPGPGSVTQAAPSLSLFGSAANVNGNWNLYAVDDVGGDLGSISGGWSIRFNVPAAPLPGGYTYYWTPSSGLSTTTTVPVAASPMQTTTYTVLATAPGGCQTTASLTINVNQLPAITVPPASISVCAGQPATFTASATGAGITYRWQLSTDAGVTWTNLNNGAPYSGVTTATLTVTPTTTAMNNYRYRVVVSGTCPPAANSAAAILTVKDLPVIDYTPASPVCGGIAGVSGTQITAGSQLPPVPGTVTASSGTISVAIPEGTFPNPPATAAQNTINVAGIPANATITGVRVSTNITHPYVGDVVMVLKAPNGQVLNLDAILNATNNPGANFVNTVISSAGTTRLDAGTSPWTGTFRADLVGATFSAFGFTLAGGPVGFTPSVNTWPSLYSVPNGAWTLAMYDAGAPDLGTLTSWSITVDYTTPGGAGNPLTYTWSPAGGLYTESTATVPYVLGTQTPTVYAAPSTFQYYTITGTNSTTGCSNTATVLVNYMPPKPTITPSAVVMCATDTAVRLTSSTSTTLNSTFNSGTISVVVPDNNPAGATHTINASGIPANAVVTGAAVTFNMAHTWAGDVAIALRAPNNNVINLDYYLSASGGTGATTGFVNTVISSTGTAALSSGSNPYTGTFAADLAGAAAAPPGGPTGNIPNVTTWPAFFNSTNGNGAWTLAMRDGFAGDQGTLTSWSLRLTYTVGTPASPAMWSPAAGLFTNAAGTIPYVAGTQRDTVWAKPAATTTYSVTVNGIGPDATPTFSNNSAITINDGAVASPYPSAITVSGLPTSGARVQSVVLSGVNHTWSDDIDVVLQSPSGTNVTLMSDVGGTGIITNATYTFTSTGAAMSTTAANLTGTYRPTNNGAADTYPAPGPGALNDASPALASFTGNFNGAWRLFIVDDVFGDNGNVSGGWNITFAYPTVGCTSAATLVPVTVNIPASITAQPVNAVVCTDKVTSFTVTAAGTSPAHNWQYSTQNGNPGTWVTISNGGVFSGAATATLTITAPPVSMNGWLFRDSVKGAAPCGAAISNNARLTVNPLPAIVLGVAPYTRLFPGLKTTISSTVAPAAATYTWLRNGATVGGANASTLVVDVDGLGDYTLRVTDVNGCVNTSNMVTVSDSITGRVFIYPNPNSGQFQVRYHSAVNNVVLPRGINVYDARGKRISTQAYSIGAPYARMDVDLRNHGTGVYWIEVVDVNGNRLAIGRAEVLR
jgi:subtilisin-like proprotein convertase family protein